MKKIPTIFERDWNGDKSRVTEECNSQCLWVFAGEGVATRKYDGMACMYDGKHWYKRREIRDEDVARKGLPDGFVEADRDMTTAKRIGWVPIGNGPEDQYLRAAALAVLPEHLRPGTFEFLGPKSQGGIEKDFPEHYMYRHDHASRYPDVPRTFDAMRDWLADKNIEGLVFHHPDGRMAKIKKRDFGMKR